jgi:hypothetical protein
MAIQLEANYSKKIGLPKYSSHQFSLTIKSELSDINQVENEANRLYALLQTNVDREIQQIGFVPDGKPTQNGNETHSPANNEFWACTAKQRDLILEIVEQNKLDKNEIEKLAQARFSNSVKQLNTLQASGLIKELLEKYPRQQPQNGNGNRRYTPPYRKAAR